MRLSAIKILASLASVSLFFFFSTTNVSACVESNDVSQVTGCRVSTYCSGAGNVTCNGTCQGNPPTNKVYEKEVLFTYTNGSSCSSTVFFKSSTDCETTNMTNQATNLQCLNPSTINTCNQSLDGTPAGNNTYKFTGACTGQNYCTGGLGNVCVNGFAPKTNAGGTYCDAWVCGYNCNIATNFSCTPYTGGGFGVYLDYADCTAKCTQSVQCTGCSADTSCSRDGTTIRYGKDSCDNNCSVRITACPTTAPTSTPAPTATTVPQTPPSPTPTTAPAPGDLSCALTANAVSVDDTGTCPADKYCVQLFPSYTGNGTNVGYPVYQYWDFGDQTDGANYSENATYHRFPKDGATRTVKLSSEETTGSIRKCSVNTYITSSTTSTSTTVTAPAPTAQVSTGGPKHCMKCTAPAGSGRFPDPKWQYDNNCNNTNTFGGSCSTCEEIAGNVYPNEVDKRCNYAESASSTESNKDLLGRYFFEDDTPNDLTNNPRIYANNAWVPIYNWIVKDSFANYCWMASFLRDSLGNISEWCYTDKNPGMAANDYVTKTRSCGGSSCVSTFQLISWPEEIEPVGAYTYQTGGPYNGCDRCENGSECLEWHDPCTKGYWEGGVGVKWVCEAWGHECYRSQTKYKDCNCGQRFYCSTTSATYVPLNGFKRNQQNTVSDVCNPTNGANPFVDIVWRRSTISDASLSGKAFLDTNCDGTSEGVLSGGVRIDLTGTDTASTPRTTGTNSTDGSWSFTKFTAKAGNYTITATPVDTATTWVACSGTNNTNTITYTYPDLVNKVFNVGFKPISGPWFQTVDADVYSNGTLASSIPATCTPTINCNPYFDLVGNYTGGHPGVPVYSGSLNLGAGTVSTKKWNANTTYQGLVFNYDTMRNSVPKTTTFNAAGSTSTWTGLVQALPPLTIPFSSTSAGFYHTCGLTAAGTAYCWGDNSYGQLGNGTINLSTKPVPVSGGYVFTRLVAGDSYTCGIASSGTYCWGQGYYGQLGNGLYSSSTIPVQVLGTSTLVFTQLVAGSEHACGLTATGKAYCWGRNTYAQLGHALGSKRSVPDPVEGGLVFSSLAAGYKHTCGITATGTYCWGSNYGGLLGINDWNSTFKQTPTLVSGGHAFTSLALGDDHTCGATSSATYCWGINFEGQLGNSSLSDSKLIPALVTGGHVFTTLVAGNKHTCGLTATGTAYCWGYNAISQLGNGTTSRSSTPVLVSGGKLFSNLTAINHHTCGKTMSSLSFCWGSNFYGQLGNGTFAEGTVPTAVTLPITQTFASPTQTEGIAWQNTTGDLTINESTTATFAVDNKSVLFVNGNLNIEQNIKLTAGKSFLAVIVKGNIYISPNVTDLHGIFVANGTIFTGTKSTSTTKTPDVQLNVRGSLIGWGGVSLQRDLDPARTTNANNTKPAEVITSAPDLFLNFPKALLKKYVIWREVAP